jgi:hypothetical protein
MRTSKHWSPSKRTQQWSGSREPPCPYARAPNNRSEYGTGSAGGWECRRPFFLHRALCGGFAVRNSCFAWQDASSICDSQHFEKIFLGNQLPPISIPIKNILNLAWMVWVLPATCLKISIWPSFVGGWNQNLAFVEYLRRSQRSNLKDLMCRNSESPLDGAKTSNLNLSLFGALGGYKWPRLLEFCKKTLSNDSTLSWKMQKHAKTTWDHPLWISWCYTLMHSRNLFGAGI